MRNILRHSKEFVEKHKKHHHLFLAVLALVVAGAGVYTYRHEIAQAATYTFTQGSWTGGISATMATHALNGDMASPKTAWTYYSATSSTSVLVSGSGVSLASTAYTFVDDGQPYAKWNPLDMGAGVTLSNSNRTVAVNSSSGTSVRATVGKSSGKWYWELKINAIPSYLLYAGVANLSASLAVPTGYDINGWSMRQNALKFNNGSNGSYGSSWAVNDILGVALDMDAGTITLLKNNVSMGTMFSGLTGTIYPSVGSIVAGAYQITANFAPADLVYAPPTGFNAGLYVSPLNPSLTSGGSFEAGASSSTALTGTGSAASVGLGGTNPGFTVTSSVTPTTLASCTISGVTGPCTVHTFLASGTFQVTAGSADVNYLVVGGGGGGFGNSGMGGAGAGGFLTGTLSAMTTTSPTTVTVGAGGTSSGTRGATSTFATINATGGGYPGFTAAAGSGGSGGGGAGYGYAGTAAGAGNTPATTPSQGNSGGLGGATAPGGGGGAGGAGATGAAGGAGGVGIASSISGASVTYAAGGHGGSVAGAAGAANTGNGAGYVATSGAAGGSGIVIVRYLTPSYNTTGTFTSAVINLGGKSATAPTFSWANTVSASTSVSMQVRTSTDNVTWGSYSSISNGGTLSSGIQYVQYQATLSTTDTNYTPTLDSVTIGYTQYALSGNLTSSPYDTSADGNLASGVSWLANTTSGTETVKFQVRSSADGITWSNWCGLADSGSTCTGTNYFTTSGSAFPTVGTHPLNSGVNDRYLQYKVFLTSGGTTSPVLTSATLQYVVNAPPIVSNVTASQGSDGVVTVGYDISDSDNGIGNIADVTLQYCTTSCSPGTEVWVNAVTVSGAVGTGVALGTGKVISWTPATDYASQFKLNTQKIRIKSNDRDAANNLGYGTSGTFTLDTALPTATVTLDSSGDADIVNLNVSDETVSGLQYRLCDDATFAVCDAWASITSGVATPVTKVLTRVGGNDQVTLEAKDAYGNIYTQTAVGPANPASFDFKDVSNLAIGNYREFLSWSVFVATTSSQFRSGHSPASYQVWHKIDTDPGYTLLTTITDPAINYYRHDITTATTSTHFYKVVTIDEDGDISDPTTILSDVPNGQGGSDTTAPQIVGSITVPAGTLKNNSAYVAWTTDEISKGTVQYSLDGLNSWTTVTSLSYVVDHSIYLPNLTASRTYNLRVKAEDPTGNGASDPYITGPNFSTVGGPEISEINEKDKTDNSITIEWKTSTSSDSYVYYATSQELLLSATPSFNANQAVCAPPGTCQHQIPLTGLSAGTTYWYSVKSTDALGNMSTANVYTNGNPLSFTTTHDVTAPVISTSTTPVLSSTAAVIVWATDEPANSQVIWGSSDINLNLTSTLDSTYTLIHVKTLSADVNDLAGSPIILAADTPYYYRVKSSDPAGNPTTFPAIADVPATFRTTTTGDVTITVINVVNSASAAGATPDTTPPSISNVTVSDITPFGATVKFGTDEDAVGLVKYGKDSLYGDTASDDTWGTTHTIKFHGLTLGSQYHFLSKAIDKSGNTGTDTDQTFTTKFLTEGLDTANVTNIEAFQKEIEAAIESVLPSLVPPFVAKPQVTDITESTANVTFKTNIKAFPVVVYADDGSYDSTKDNPYTGEVSDTNIKDTTHTLALTGLKGNTKYHVQARAFSLPKVIGKSADITFTTKAAKIAGSIVERKKDSFTVAWITDEPSSSIVEFKNMKSGITERKTDDTKKTAHSMKVENLPSGTTYSVDISGINQEGNVVEAGASLSVTTSRDVTAPTISGFKVDNALVPGRTDRIQTIVSWTTDEPANETVYYEEGAGAAGDTKELANKNEVLDSYTIAHSVVLPNLKPGTIYRLKVTSSDDSGNVGSFGPRTVITPRQTESITDIIFKNFEDSFKFLKKI